MLTDLLERVAQTLRTKTAICREGFVFGVALRAGIKRTRTSMRGQLGGDVDSYHDSAKAELSSRRRSASIDPCDIGSRCDLRSARRAEPNSIRP